MKEQFVTPEIAKELKELGFDEPCLACFDEHRNYQISYANSEIIEVFGGYTGKLLYDPSNYPSVLAPLWQQVIDWFAIKFNIDIIISSNLIGYGFILYNRYPPKNTTNNKVFEFHKDALKEAILKAIELIKTK